MMKIYHADVFSDKAFAGNGLTVIFPDRALSEESMLVIAQEFKQFETIYLWQRNENEFDARIFTVEEELDFAGHPILGAAAVIQEQMGATKMQQTVTFHLKNKLVMTDCSRMDGHYEVVMNQGKAVWGNPISEEWKMTYCQHLNIPADALYAEYPMEVVSTGLPYLLIPIRYGLENVAIQGDDFEKLLASNGAKFTYIIDLEHLEGRTWENIGKNEDVATGSAAGPVGAYLCQHGCARMGEEILLHQGRFLHRPSILKIRQCADTQEMTVAGDVKILMHGEME